MIAAPFAIRTVIAALVVAIALPAAAAERHLRTYQMQRALPEQVLPALQPLLSAGSSAQSFQNQLILNVTDAEYDTALDLLKQLDVAARSLLISVRKASQSRSSDSQYGIDGRIGRGDVQVRTGNSPSSRTDIYGDSRNVTSNRDGSQQVRATEGLPAFISAGSTQMVTTRSSPYGTTRELVPAESGFYATARVIGDEVVIDIDQRDDRLQGRTMHSQTLQTQSIQTQVRGRIGEWIPIGSLDGGETHAGRSLTGAANSSTTTSGTIALKVELSAP